MHTHERVLAEGTFRLVLTEKRRLVAALDADTALGPLHVVVNVDHAHRSGEQRLALERSLLGHNVGFSLPDISLPKIKLPGPIGDVATAAFGVAKNVMPSVAMPALSLLHGAAQGGALLSQHVPHLEAASRIIARSKIGDVVARQFVQNAINAARAHIPGAKAIANKLLDAHRLFEHVNELTDPVKKAERAFAAMSKGDWNAVRELGETEARNVASAAAMIPGLGTGVAAGIAAGLAALEGGGPLEVAILTAYGALPIPPIARHLTDPALDGVLALIMHGGSLTDVGVNAARAVVPEGIGREVFDTLMHVVARRVPIETAVAERLENYVHRYAPTPFAHALEHFRHATTEHPALPAHHSPWLLPAHLADHVAAAAAHPDHARLVRPLFLAPSPHA
jgi:hypothetical protein